MIAALVLAAALGAVAPAMERTAAAPATGAPAADPVADAAPVAALPTDVAPIAALPVDARVAGQSIPDLAAAWWRWAYRRRDGMRPYQDPTGAQCHVSQPEAIWFLAGTAGTGAVERRCAVPENMPVFFPVLVVLETSKPGRRRDCAALRAEVAAEAARPVAVRVELDGVALAPVRAASRECFDAYADAEEDDPPPGLYAPAHTDGLWMRLPPLGRGVHRLVVDAKQAADGIAPGRYDQQFTYVLDVGGEAADVPSEEASAEPAEQLTL